MATFPPAEREKAPWKAPVRRGPTEAGPQVRLSIGKDGVGFELSLPERIGCLVVVELLAAIPNLRFPLDVSGGVARFRHKRADLTDLVLELAARDLERWAAPRLAGLLGKRPPTVWASVRRAAATLAVVDEDPHLPAPRVLAFDVVAEAEHDDVHLTIAAPRGAGLPAPASSLAMRCVRGLLGGLATQRGTRFTVTGASRRIARRVLPEAGFRAPASDGMRVTVLAAQGDTWLLSAASEGNVIDATPEGSRARETWLLTEQADEARLRGDLERARDLDVEALGRAPRHREISRRIAELDQLAGGRAEAALATLAEAERDPTAPEGLLVGELLAEVGDRDAAIAALVRSGETEPTGALSARAFERASELTANPTDALAWLDMAVARAPSLAHMRWTRIQRRLEIGRVEDALADAEHLDAQAHGPAARHAVWRRAGELWQARGLGKEATALFERALRFEPDDVAALAGLGAALVSSDRAPRGAALIATAIGLAEVQGKPASAMRVELAKALADKLGDRPAAIARVQEVPREAREALVARALEGRWRAEMGDLAGASLAFARLRDLAGSQLMPHKGGPDGDLLGAWLVEAARFELDRREDPLAAQRLLACALKLAPRFAEAQELYRQVGALIARPPEPADVEADDPSPFRRTEPPSGERRAFDLDLAPSEAAGEGGDAEDNVRVEELTRLLQLDPNQDAIVDELALRLTRLGRTHELLALLSARLEEAPPERRAALIPQQRAVLERLEADARAAGRDLEASFFRDALKMLDGQ